MTCVADGTLLNFLTTGEICTIVGTALDNATESVLTEQDPESADSRGRLRQNGFVMLRFENYCAKPVELGQDGLPRQSSHGGYDLKSVRAAAETHGGTVTLHWENEWFTLRYCCRKRMNCEKTPEIAPEFLMAQIAQTGKTENWQNDQ
mgnify:CR=1 FL=1